MMNTPVADFIEKYNNDEFVRLHVPGHKGKGSLCEASDITEIDGADVLYHETGILGESQNNAAMLFGTKKTVYSAEGSSLCIRAMLALIKMQAAAAEKKPLVFAAGNAHKVFMTACALLDIDVKFLYPEEFGGVVSCEITVCATITTPPPAISCLIPWDFALALSLPYPSNKFIIPHTARPAPIAVIVVTSPETAVPKKAIIFFLFLSNNFS